MEEFNSDLAETFIKALKKFLKKHNIAYLKVCGCGCGESHVVLKTDEGDFEFEHIDLEKRFK